ILRAYWGSITQIVKIQPLKLVNRYLGPEVAFYFAWLGYFVCMSIPLALLGILTFTYSLLTLETPEDQRIKDVCENSRFLCPNCISYNHCNFTNLQDSCYYSKLNYVFDNQVTTLFAFVTILWAIVFIVYWKKHEEKLKTEWNLFYTAVDHSTRSGFVRNLKQWKIQTVVRDGEPGIPFVWKFSVRIISILALLALVKTISSIEMNSK
ncbi:hypothetical protein ILUMI_03206, partial [Ignelater luminosus]